MKYLENILNVKLRYQKVGQILDLPYYLTDRYTFKFAYIDTTKMLFVFLNNNDNFQWRELKKHVQILEEKFQVPIVLVLNYINSYERNILITNNQPFIVEGNQVYLPFLGLMLQESYKKKINKQLTPLSQLIYLYFIYSDKNRLYIDDLKDDISITNMSLSRAFKQIENLNEIYTEKDGVKKYIFIEKNKREIFEANRDYLIKPIRRKIYVEKISDFMRDSIVESGELALSKYSMLAEPQLKTYAVKADIKNITHAQYNLFDSSKQDCIEIWKYDPTYLSKKFFNSKIIDILSLYSYMNEEEDERIKKELECTYNKFWEEKIGKRDR